jgi:hypothetical protein
MVTLHDIALIADWEKSRQLFTAPAPMNRRGGGVMGSVGTLKDRSRKPIVRLAPAVGIRPAKNEKHPRTN